MSGIAIVKIRITLLKFCLLEKLPKNVHNFQSQNLIKKFLFYSHDNKAWFDNVFDYPESNRLEDNWT